MKMFDLTGKVAIVTGASKGIGQAFAVALAEAGADIVGVSRSASDKTAESVRAHNRKYLELIEDLVTTAPVERIVSAALNEFGHIDILVNNAGIIRREDSLKFTERDWDDVMNVNLKSLFFLSQAVAKQMVKNNIKGKIINVASMLSFQGGMECPATRQARAA